MPKRLRVATCDASAAASAASATTKQTISRTTIPPINTIATIATEHDTACTQYATHFFTTTGPAPSVASVKLGAISRATSSSCALPPPPTSVADA